MKDIYGIKEFCDKLCQFLSESVNNDDLIKIDCIFLVFNKLATRLGNDLPEIIFQIIDFILENNYGLNSIFLKNIRFSLTFIIFLDKMRIIITKILNI